VPKDYADTFRVMGEVGLFDMEFMEELMKALGAGRE
jgi:uncharacterized protein YutE (UPF0331/DUF86 family)